MTESEQAAMTLVRDLVHGRWKTQALAATLRLGIPDVLEAEPATVPALATALQLDEDALERLMCLMAALSVVARDDAGRYDLTEASRRLLPEHPKTLARDAAYTLSATVRGTWAETEHAVRTGDTAFERLGYDSMTSQLADHPGDAAAVHDYQAGVAGHNAAALAETHTFPPTGTVVVVGEPNAPILVQLLRQNPDLRGALVIDAADRDAAGRAVTTVSDRVELTESVPAAGTYVLQHVLHSLPDDRATELLRTLARAMGDDAKLVIVAAAKQDVGSQLLAAYLDVRQFLVSAGRERTDSEYETLLGQAGLVLVSSLAMAGRPGIRVLTARRAGPV